MEIEVTGLFGAYPNQLATASKKGENRRIDTKDHGDGAGLMTRAPQKIPDITLSLLSATPHAPRAVRPPLYPPRAHGTAAPSWQPCVTSCQRGVSAFGWTRTADGVPGRLRLMVPPLALGAGGMWPPRDTRVRALTRARPRLVQRNLTPLRAAARASACARDTADAVPCCDASVACGNAWRPSAAGRCGDLCCRVLSSLGSRLTRNRAVAPGNSGRGQAACERGRARAA